MARAFTALKLPQRLQGSHRRHVSYGRLSKNIYGIYHLHTNFSRLPLNFFTYFCQTGLEQNLRIYVIILHSTTRFLSRYLHVLQDLFLAQFRTKINGLNLFQYLQRC